MGLPTPSPEPPACGVASDFSRSGGTGRRAARTRSCPGRRPTDRSGRRRGRSRHRARGATDRGVALLVERVPGDVVLGGIGLDVDPRPVAQRVGLVDQLAGEQLMDLGQLQVAPSPGLVGADRGEPQVVAGQRLVGRPHLAQLTTPRRVEGVLLAVFRLVLGHRRRWRRDREVEVPPVDQHVEELECLREVVPGVDEDDVDVGVVRHQQVEQHEATELHGTGHRRALRVRQGEPDVPIGAVDGVDGVVVQLGEGKCGRHASSGGTQRLPAAQTGCAGELPTPPTSARRQIRAHGGEVAAVPT